MVTQGIYDEDAETKKGGFQNESKNLGGGKGLSDEGHDIKKFFPQSRDGGLCRDAWEKVKKRERALELEGGSGKERKKKGEKAISRKGWWILS